MAKKQRKVRKNVGKGIAHVRASFNNTIVTITAESAAAKARKMGLTEVEVRLNGAGGGRESAVNGLASQGLRVTALEDRTPIPHNGCRPRKKRRV